MFRSRKVIVLCGLVTYMASLDDVLGNRHHRVFARLSRRPIVQSLSRNIRLMVEDKMTIVYLAFLMFILALGILGPYLAPHPYNEPIYSNGEILLNTPPSFEHPLGTNDSGQDVLSRLMYGARPTVITGLIGGSMIAGIGMTVGITAGYFGGKVDEVLMRFTDLIYGVPLIPFAIVLVTLFGVGFIESVIVIGIILWRGNARVIRSQVLQIKERPYILAARATGASRARIAVKHILPNVAPMAVLFFSLGVGLSILIQASLAFLGASNPLVPSWGNMVRNAYDSGLMSYAWWWSFPPGLMISLTVLATYMVGRSYESVAGLGDDESIVQAG